MTIIFAGILTAFWSVVGATGLENPGIPYLLVEAALTYTAKITWFTTWVSGFFYFAIPISICSILAGLTLLYRVAKKKADSNEQYYLGFSLLLMVITIIFSFGLNLPLFKYLPLAESVVPGRILGLTSATGAILSSYLLFQIAKSSEKKKLYYQVSANILILSLMLGSFYTMNPYDMQYRPIQDKTSNMLSNNTELSSFEKGRYTYIAPVDSSETYFPLTQDYNISDGWNIEGTPHNRTIWNFIIANPSNCYSYIAKSLAFWNVRDLLLSKEYQDVVYELNNKYSFEFKMGKKSNYFYSSEEPSSYFLFDHRNALIFGAGAPGLAIEFPYLVSDQRNDITDFSIEELAKYKLIYICEPKIKTLEQKAAIEDMMETLISKGITVIIEPTAATGYSLFDVAVADVALENSPAISKQSESPIRSAVDNIAIDEGMNYGRSVFGLDKVYYKLEQNDGALQNNIIGTKKVRNGEVIFIGMHLSQYLKAVYIRNWGVPKDSSGYPKCSNQVKALFEDIFAAYGVNKNFWPDPFPVKRADWNYKGVDFEYSSQTEKEMTLSVTCSPRWKATLDGKLIPVGQKENLITLDLPAGEHKVKLAYGLTKYGIAGYIISLLGLLILILFLKFYDIINQYFRQISTKIGKFLQLRSADQQKKIDG